MFNPLTPDLSTMSDKELTDKIHELWRRAALMRYHYAHNQLQALIHQYTAEFERRQANKSSQDK
jgi:ribosomal protein L29